MGEAKRTPGSKRILRYIATASLFVLATVLLLMWLAGAFHRKVGTSLGPSEHTGGTARPIGDRSVVAVRLIRVPRIESSVGTIRAVHETSIASKLLAKVVEVRVTAGQHVTSDETLVRLDDADLVARWKQAKAAVDGAKAARDQARIEYDRVQQLVAQQAAAKIERDRVDAALKSAEAELSRAQQVVREAQTVLGYATICSPIDGIVVDKKVEVGDTATPGQVLLTLYDPTHMQLVASVRESLTRRLAVGQTVNVHVDALDKTCPGRVSEIVPEAESASRTFSVKVTGPCPPGIYSGMFGRLLIPLDDEEVLVIPRAAVRRVGQLDLVDVTEGGVLHRRALQLGRTIGTDVQVLAGLQVGERVALQPTGTSSGTSR